MFGLSTTSKTFCSLFALLTAVALGHDLYIWQKDGNDFSFAYLGGIFKRYLPEEFKTTVDTLGAENFNILLTPFLSMPAVFLFGGLLAFSFAAGLAGALVKKAKMGKQVVKQDLKRSTMSYKDQVKHRLK
ncbi:MAG TPA: hypothetical protein PKI93_01345 [Alphaproteobacteria bacterium]|nr:hypothetical protein [Alphaproteobacteria bacterium]HNS44442.1 hypothetical protein [Alphaproteobacteria bacterium]